MANTGNLEFDASIDISKLKESVNKIEKELQKMSNEAQKAGRNLDDAFDGKGTGKLNSEISTTNKHLNSVEGSAGKAGGALGKIGGMVSFAAIAAGASALVQSIISVRSEFEKYEAVLTNSLGSEVLAKKAMGELTDFAAKTPFALSELTGAYVKLTNYGLKPNIEKMTLYGDVAASVGKSFDQFAEAAADAVTGEFERLKEFGIKASKEGDKITFTFKGQKTEIQNSAEAIDGYLQSLGKMEGVAGSMEAISGTLGGKISNLGDAWDRMLNSMGNESSGVFVTVIGWLTKVVEGVEWLTKSLNTMRKEALEKNISNSGEAAKSEIKTMQDSFMRNGMGEAEAAGKAVEIYRKRMNEAIVQAESDLNKVQDKYKDKKYLKFSGAYKDAQKEIIDAQNNVKLLKGEMDIINSTYKTKEEKESGTVEKQINELKKQISNSEQKLKEMRSLSSKSSVEDIEKQEKNLADLKNKLKTLTGVNVDAKFTPGTLKGLEEQLKTLQGKVGTFTNPKDEQKNANEIAAIMDKIALKKLEVAQLSRDDQQIATMKGQTDSLLKSQKELTKIQTAYEKAGLKQGQKLTTEQKKRLDYAMQQVEKEAENTEFQLEAMPKLTDEKREQLELAKKQAEIEEETYERIRENVDKAIGISNTLANGFSELGNLFGGFDEQLDAVLNDTIGVIDGFSSLLTDAQSGQKATMSDYTDLLSLAIQFNTLQFKAIDWILGKITGKEFNTLDGIKNFILDNDQWTEDMTGISSNDIADTIATGIMDGMKLGADGSLGDFADGFEDMIKKAAVKAITESINKETLDKIQEQISAARGKNSEGGEAITENEYKQMQETYAAGVRAAEDNAKAWEIVMGTSEKVEAKAYQRSISGMTEETAGLLEGRMNSIQFNVIAMKEMVDKQLVSLQKIEVNTSYNRYLETMPDHFKQLKLIAEALTAIKNAGSGTGNYFGV